MSFHGKRVSRATRRTTKICIRVDALVKDLRSFFFSPPSLFHVSDSEIVSGDNFFDALDNGVVVCRLARVIQEKARTAIDAGRAKGVSNSFSLSGSTFENWMRISIDRNVEVRFYLISFLHFLLIIVINSIEN